MALDRVIGSRQEWTHFLPRQEINYTLLDRNAFLLLTALSLALIGWSLYNKLGPPQNRNLPLLSSLFATGVLLPALASQALLSLTRAREEGHLTAPLTLSQVIDSIAQDPSLFFSQPSHFKMKLLEEIDRLDSGSALRLAPFWRAIAYRELLLNDTVFNITLLQSAIHKGSILTETLEEIGLAARADAERGLFFYQAFCPLWDYFKPAVLNLKKEAVNRLFTLFRAVGIDFLVSKIQERDRKFCSLWMRSSENYLSVFEEEGIRTKPGKFSEFFNSLERVLTNTHSLYPLSGPRLITLCPILWINGNNLLVTSILKSYPADPRTHAVLDRVENREIASLIARADSFTRILPYPFEDRAITRRKSL